MNWKQTLGTFVALAAIGGTGWFGWQRLHNESIPLPSAESNERPRSDGKPLRRISLRATQLEAYNVQTMTARETDLELRRSLPARFVYDDTRHVAIRTPTDGVLQSVLVKVGDAIDEGQAVAVLRSPSIGDARNEYLAAQSDLKLTLKAARWEGNIRDGVRELTRAIQAGQPVAQINEKLKEQTTGDYGGKLLTAYSQTELAGKIAQSVGSIGGSGAISGRVVRERQSARQQSEAKLQAIIEQSRFETEHAMQKARAKVEAAERTVRIAEQTLATLIGGQSQSVGGLKGSPNDPDLSQLTIRSPIRGTVEKKSYSAAERVSAQDELFVIADTSQLWVEADIRSRDWNSVKVREGVAVTVTVPSVDLPPQPAQVYFVGRQVDPQSGAIPLVASIDNSDGQFRPGQFARVSVPTERLKAVIAVPTSAIVDLEGQPSVFVRNDDFFFPIGVVIGRQSEDLVEIREGIDAGQTVVVTGAFLLKSELLLEGEQ